MAKAFVLFGMREPFYGVVFGFDVCDCNPTFEDTRRYCDSLKRIAALNQDDATSEVVLNALKKKKSDNFGFGKLLSRGIVGVKVGGKIQNIVGDLQRFGQLLKGDGGRV